ncbi:MAG: Lrp/AsnC ligand binding domain-containing protein [Nitrososphaerota archaeon]|nr:Lrp/AsnC ligand binding domain-containing protein [Aigarchaeota archaeon]MDW8076781.1 Lrp/AsnC ligand binding domain-containing protein [Nitrososphaerota archaeon]
MQIAYVLLSVEPGYEEETLSELKQIPNVKEACRVYGVYDIVVRIEAEDHEKLRTMISRIRHIQRIRSTTTLIVWE